MATPGPVPAAAQKTNLTGPGSASSKGMRVRGFDKRWHRGVAACVVTLLLLSFAEPAKSRTRHHRKALPVAVALEPFLVAHSVVHRIALPIVSHASQAVVTVATAPLRAAYRTAHDHRGEVLRAELVEENEREHFSQPFRVAYQVPRTQRPDDPSPDQPDMDDQDSNTSVEEDEPAQASPAGPTVSGNRAILRGGIAYAPSRAPQSVKNAIWAANSLRRKPYIWGGGHGGFYDRGYDCSGTVSFALHGAGAIASPLPSSDFMRYGENGRGRWVTIYARSGHTFAMIAGLRLDTTDFQNGGNTGPRWHADLRDTRGYVARHPVGL